jgi:hypothetical protein
MDLGTIKVKGIDYKVSVDKTGIFWTTLNGSQITAKNLDALRDKIARTIKPVSIPVVTISDDWWDDEQGEIIDYTITGIHGGNNNIMVKKKGHKDASQLRATFYNPGIDRKKLKELRAAKTKANNDYDAFLEKHEIKKETILAEIERQQTAAE